MNKIINSLKVLLIPAMLLLVTDCAINPVTGKTQIMLVSEAQEIQMGKDYDPQVIATFGEYKNDAILSFVKAKGTELGKISHRPNLVYNFRILDSPVVNAFAVPGGYIYLTRGILAQLNDEAELAGVVAHEIGHIAARHSAEQYSQAQVAQLGLGLGSMVSETFRKYAGVAQLGVSMLFLSFS